MTRKKQPTTTPTPVDLKVPECKTCGETLANEVFIDANGVARPGWTCKSPVDHSPHLHDGTSNFRVTRSHGDYSVVAHSAAEAAALVPAGLR